MARLQDELPENAEERSMEEADEAAPRTGGGARPRPERTARLQGTNEAPAVEGHERRLFEQVRLRLIGEIVEAQERERLSLAQALHDEVVQELLALGYQMAQQRREVTNDAVGETERLATVAASLRATEEHVTGIARRLRGYISELRPAGLHDLGLTSALKGYVAQLQRETNQDGPGIVLDLEEIGLELPYQLSVLLFRAAQEALHNALRRPGTSLINVRLFQDHTGVHLMVSDDGMDVERAPSPTGVTRPGHSSPVYLSDRVDLRGGAVTVTSSPDSGTILTVHIPVPDEEVQDG